MSTHAIEWLLLLAIFALIAWNGARLKRQVRREREADERRAREKGEPYVAEMPPLAR